MNCKVICGLYSGANDSMLVSTTTNIKYSKMYTLKSAVMFIGCQNTFKCQLTTETLKLFWLDIFIVYSMNVVL